MSEAKVSHIDNVLSEGRSAGKIDSDLSSKKGEKAYPDAASRKYGGYLGQIIEFFEFLKDSSYSMLHKCLISALFALPFIPIAVLLFFSKGTNIQGDAYYGEVHKCYYCGHEAIADHYKFDNTIHIDGLSKEMHALTPANRENAGSPSNDPSWYGPY